MSLLFGLIKVCSMKYQGGCHCGAVKFEFEAEEPLQCIECNCSVCTKTGYLHHVLPQAQLKVESGWDSLTTYTFNTGVAKHYFCRVCGIKPFYVPRSHPDCYSVNIRCLEPVPKNIRVTPFDGQNWEDNIHQIAG